MYRLLKRYTVPFVSATYKYLTFALSILRTHKHVSVYSLLQAAGKFQKQVILSAMKRNLVTSQQMLQYKEKRLTCRQNRD